MFKLMQGDCLELMKDISDNTVDSIITDPPYELGFMGKKWDSTGIAYNVEVWKECLRVLKPGGHLLAFGGTRTYHRMACAIEDAGFEIRDCIQWLYGSGFPKSHNISKAIDKRLGAERVVTALQKTRDLSRHDGEVKGDMLVGKSRGSAIIERKDKPATHEAQEWEGWGTALKPANEPIVLARKLISEKTIADNVLKWGTGGLNIDDCRVEHNEKIKTTQRSGRQNANVMTDSSCGFDNTKNNIASANPDGRFPANVILDEEAGKLLDEQSGISKGSSKPRKNKGSGNNCYGDYKTIITQNDTWGDVGGASRFFYCAKASKKERGEGNNHPTVKPIKLIEYLIKLITPTNGLVIDPFMGSGTTGVACKNLNRNFIGIELDEGYFKIAKERIGVE